MDKLVLILLGISQASIFAMIAFAKTRTSASVNSHLQLLNIQTTTRQLSSVYPRVESMRSTLGHHGDRALDDRSARLDMSKASPVASQMPRSILTRIHSCVISTGTFISFAWLRAFFHSERARPFGVANARRCISRRRSGNSFAYLSDLWLMQCLHSGCKRSDDRTLNRDLYRPNASSSLNSPHVLQQYRQCPSAQILQNIRPIWLRINRSLSKIVCCIAMVLLEGQRQAMKATL